MQKLIETAIPLSEINCITISEHTAASGHPAGLHLWWNRSPIYSSASLLYAAMTNATTENAADFDDALKSQKLHRVLSLEEKQHMPTVVEPFCGFGGLGLAAQSLGLNACISDINAVATLLTKAATEIPARFGKQYAIHPSEKNRSADSSTGLRADIEYYGTRMIDAVKELLKEHYPKVMTKDGILQDVAAWIWVRTTTCPNPACSCRMPLASSFVLSKKKDHEFWAEPFYSNGVLNFQVHAGICPEGKHTNKVGSNGAVFRCPQCGSLTTDAYVKQQAKSGDLLDRIMALCVKDQNGKYYIAPDAAQLKAANINVSANAPESRISTNSRWFSPPFFGKNEYRDIYLSRQLLLMGTLVKEIQQIQKKATSDAVAAGLEHDGVGLAAGGSGAQAYGQAIAVYLTLAIGKLSNFQSTICTWDNRTGNIRATFTRQALPMTWTFAEGNPFSSVTGNLYTMLKTVCDSVGNLPVRIPAEVTCADATEQKYPNNSILFTELPYMDNVGYAELSDYFYIWHRMALKDVYPELYQTLVTSRNELSTIPENHGGSSQQATKTYWSGIEKMLLNFSKCASRDYPSVIFYELGVNELDSDSSDTPLAKLLNILVNSGYHITALWPVRTEKPNVRFITYRIAIVFRKKAAKLPPTTRRGFITAMKRELAERLDTIFTKTIDPCDRFLPAMGAGIALFSRYPKVLNADATIMTVHDAVQVIRPEVNDYLEQRFQIPEGNEEN